MSWDLPAPARALSDALVAWFEVHRRALPWRTDRSPYRVWLSEVMLQQTQVAVVEDYYRRFLARFPDVRALAAAHEDEVLSLWSGLGYYSRGRNLHKAARTVVDQHEGAFPRTTDGLRTLPGVGAYTAAAIASFAFDAPSAVVDGNVNRVLARLCDDATPVDTPAATTAMQARAQALVDSAVRAGGGSAPVNEGLMELGALVCTKHAPACAACPWRGVCRAHANGTVLSLPVKSPRRPRKHLHVATVVIVDARGRVWLEKRPGKGLFGGLWEPPSALIGALDDPRAAWRTLLEERGIAGPRTLPDPVHVARTLTHRELRFSIVRVDVTKVLAAQEGSFVADPRAVGIAAAARAVLQAVGASDDASGTRRAGRRATAKSRTR